MALKTIIVEDNEFDQIILKKLISEDSELDIVGVFSSPLEAIPNMGNLKPDLIFLDVEMPQMSGIEFLNSIKDVPQIIMVTAQSSYALDAFENDVTDFIVKPMDKTRFNKAVSKAKKINEWLSLETEDDQFMYIRVDREDVKIKLKDILHVEAMADYVRIQTENEKYLVLSTMKSIYSKLPPEDFIRIHRSFIVNKTKIDKFKGTEVTIGSTILPVSRNGKKDLSLALN